MVTIGGEDVAQVNDIVHSAGDGAVAGFTLVARGLMAGPLRTTRAFVSQDLILLLEILVRGEIMVTSGNDLRADDRGGGVDDAGR